MLRGWGNSQGLLSRDHLVMQRKQTAAERAVSGNAAPPSTSSPRHRLLCGSQLRESPVSVVRATGGNRPWGSQGGGATPV